MNTPTSPPHDSPPSVPVLDPTQLLDQLAHEGDRAPLALIDACVAHGDAMVAELRGVIDGDRAWRGGSEGEWWLPLHAAFVLGRIPSEAAGALLVRLMHCMDERGDDDLQDWLAGHWPPLFANKPRSAVEAASALAADDARGAYIRSQALDVVLDAGLRDGDAALESAIDRVAAVVADETKDWWFRTMAAMSLLDFPRERHRGTLQAIADGEARRSEARGGLGRALSSEDIERDFRKGEDAPGWRRLGDPWRFYDPDAIASRQQRWREEDVRGWTRPQRDDRAPYVRIAPKIGRNDPCPCGSGRKYKRCCLARDEAAAHPGARTAP